MTEPSSISNDPLDNTDLPQIGPQHFERVDPKHLTAGLVVLTATAAAVLAFTIALAWIVSLNVDGSVAAKIGALLVLLILVGSAAQFLYLRASLSRLGYLVRERDISVRRGVLVRTVQTIPFARVQNVRAQRGPLERSLGLTSLVVTSAGGSLNIPGLRDSAAQALKELVIDRSGIDEADQ
ncbi:MAG: PH domain-containing protein [Actinomycetia bacterium]|nr:PH domain-containing protein [Actinomycetes bacterium]